ncbi:sialic acid-binding Ig-like lectin 10 [Anoplopoma fimbria]|uniref:sialic acid-binding Ig-like lectin 10 n=1 Tax=Anoplopoma fimbria TaxID=229290 RepID=UPI0023EC32DB|nr:sialic acid-binding Ig-like lectin 10 [Anoplopoma fimbria]
MFVLIWATLLFSVRGITADTGKETDCLNHQIRMFVLIWATLLFSVRGITADTGASVGERTQCLEQFCITLTGGEITAEAGLCVVIPCSFNSTNGFTLQHMLFMKCEPYTKYCQESDMIFSTDENNQVQSGFMGRVSLLEPDMSQRNCSIIINDLTESDSGSYQLRIEYSQYNNNKGFTFQLKSNVSVKGLTQNPTVMVPPLTEGQQTTLTCTAPGLCSGSDPKVTWTWRGAGNITAFMTEDLTAVTKKHSSTLTFNPSAEQHGSNVTCKVSFTNNITTEETVTLNVTYVKKPVITGMTTVKEGDALHLTCSVESSPLSTLIILNVTAECSGEYICTAKHQNTTLTTPAEVNVKYVKKPVITGMTTIKEGDALHLTCSVESSPPSVITWTKLGSNKNLQSENTSVLKNNTGTATLIILNVTAEYSGEYICTAKHQNITLTTPAEVNVKFHPKVFSSSACEVQWEVLTCVCISEGFPLPTIKWPMLKTRTEYSFTTNKSNHIVISFAKSVKDLNSTTVECVSTNEIGEAKENLQVRTKELKENDLLFAFLLKFVQPQVIIAFLIGILLASTICCLAVKCCRNKQKNSAEALEMVTTQAVPLLDAGQGVDNDQGESEEGATAAGQSASGGDVEPKELEYSAIDFSLVKRKSPLGAENTQETKDTVYAKIKNKAKEERQNDGAEEVAMVEGSEEEEVMVGEDEETKQYLPKDEEGGENVAVYSNVKEIMGEIEGLYSMEESLNN